MFRLIVLTKGNTFLPIFITLCDAQIQPNKCNSYANVFPIDDIQTWKNDNGPVSRTGYVKLSFGLKKLV